MRLLVIEDDKTMADYVLEGLRQHGHVVDHAATGIDGLVLASEEKYDVLIVDRMLPKLDGLNVVKTLRESGMKTPVLFLTAMGSVEDRVKGLEAGDDYLIKPFAFAELHARVCSLARRPPLDTQITVLRSGDLEVDLIRHSVTRANQTISLQPTEFRLLEYLLRHAGRVVTKTMLLEAVWEFNFDPKTNIVETHISRLRAKIDRGYERELIKTIRGAGYMIHDN